MYKDQIEMGNEMQFSHTNPTHHPPSSYTRILPQVIQLGFYCSAFIRSCPPPPPPYGTFPQQVFNAAKAAASSDNLNKLYVIICVYQQNNGILNVQTARCFFLAGKWKLK